MTTTFPQAILTKTYFNSSLGFFRRPDRSLLSKRVLVDCKKRKEAITIAFYKYYGYHCSIQIGSDPNYDLKIDCGWNGSSILKAMISGLNEMGITFDSPIPEDLPTDTQIECIMHSIADALAIGHPRVITHAWT